MSKLRSFAENDPDPDWANGGDSKKESDLVELEARLADEVDKDLFDDPKHFKTLDRVIDVLGSELEDARTDFEQIRHNNPAYRAIKKQLDAIEECVEYMAVAHCAELNSSVVQVGKVARQFTEAVKKVRCLRRQVQDIKESLGQEHAHPNEPITSNAKSSRSLIGTPSTPAGTAAMSLRELWLKKLESEAVLLLLNKLESIRQAPSEFDALVHPRNGGPCRIGAAVVLLSNALNIVFSEHVAQIGALHRITEQLMTRKQRAEEIIWDTLYDVLYLRTGNGVQNDSQKKLSSSNKSSGASVQASISSDSKRRGRGPASGTLKNYSNGMSNPFFKVSSQYAVDDAEDDDSVSSAGSGASLFSHDDTSSLGSSQPSSTAGRSASTNTTVGTSTYSMSNGGKNRMMIPFTLIDADLDLEQDERRCLEESALSGVGVTNTNHASWDSVFAAHSHLTRPRYADHIMALRILVESLAKLGRLDDMERYLKEEMEHEIRKIAQREQARTVARLEKHRGKSSRRSSRKEEMREFRLHLTGLLSAFGCVMLRLSHLAQIVRHRIVSTGALMCTNKVYFFAAIFIILTHFLLPPFLPLFHRLRIQE